MIIHLNWDPGKFTHSTVLCSLFLLLGSKLVLAEQAPADSHTAPHWNIDRDGIFEIAVHNSEPGLFPSMHVRRLPESDFCVYVTLTFPGLPGLVVDAWCFEGELVTFHSARELDAGGLELRHRFNATPGVLHVTTLSPENGAVDFRGRLEIEPDHDMGSCSVNADGIHFTAAPNICFQVKRAPLFQSAPEQVPRCSPLPEHARNYWDNFVSRCFIFADEGMTFLNETQRTDTSRDHGFPADDPRNNPPAVQRYYGVWQKIPPGEGTSSLTRYNLPMVGTISRDGKYLLAGADNQARFVSQAWLDCFHIYTRWTPEDQPATGRNWRIRLYGMENDPQALLARVNRDFPGIDELDDQRVPIH